MNEPGEDLPKPNYRWPWFVLAGVILFFVLTVVWVAYAVKRQSQQSDFSAPLPSSAPAR